MHEAKIIALVGMPGAGKSTCVDYLTSKGLPSVYFGGVVVDETKRRYGRVSEDLEKIVRKDLRDTEGIGAIATRMIEKIDKLIADGQTKIVADGMYSWSEYKLFKERWGENVTVITVAAARHLRHERLAHRPVRPLNEQEVVAREYNEIETIEKGGPIANADYTIVNDTTPAELLAQFQRVLDEIKF